MHIGGTQEAHGRTNRAPEGHRWDTHTKDHTRHRGGIQGGTGAHSRSLHRTHMGSTAGTAGNTQRGHSRHTGCTQRYPRHTRDTHCGNTAFGPTTLPDGQRAHRRHTEHTSCRWNLLSHSLVHFWLGAAHPSHAHMGRLVDNRHHYPQTWMPEYGPGWGQQRNPASGQMGSLRHQSSASRRSRIPRTSVSSHFLRPHPANGCAGWTSPFGFAAASASAPRL